MKMKKAVILHGTLGSPEGNWFRWLEQELASRGWKVWLPALPRAEQPSLKEWAQFVSENAPFELDGGTIIVGHSSGAVLALVIAQQLASPVEALFCIGAFKDNDFLKWEPNNRLFDTGFDFGSIRTHGGKIVFIHSDNDPYCPLEHARYFSEQTGGRLIVIPGQGHFNLEQSEGYRQFPKLLEIITKEVGV